MTETFTPKLLRSIREQKRMSISQLARLSGISTADISRYEHGKHFPQPIYWSRIWTVLCGETVDNKPLNACESLPDNWEYVQERFKCGSIPFAFEQGHCYMIKDTPFTSGAKYEQEINPMSGNFCVFRYEGKAGIHHKFVEVRGNWRRTYTDQQLIGKTIQEVQQR